MVNTKKSQGKTRGTTIELPTKFKKQNKCEAKKSVKTAERKVKAER